MDCIGLVEGLHPRTRVARLFAEVKLDRCHMVQGTVAQGTYSAKRIGCGRPSFRDSEGATGQAFHSASDHKKIRE